MERLFTEKIVFAGQDLECLDGRFNACRYHGCCLSEKGFRVLSTGLAKDIKALFED